MQKRKKKRKKNYGMFSLALFLFPIIKRAKKVSGFFYFRKGRGKTEINYKKKENFFSPSGSFFTIFGR